MIYYLLLFSTLSSHKNPCFTPDFSLQPQGSLLQPSAQQQRTHSLFLQFLDNFVPISVVYFQFLLSLPLISVLIMSRSKKSKFTPSSSSSQTDFRAFLKKPALEDFLRISSLEILPGRLVKYEDFNDYDILLSSKLWSLYYIFYWF